MKTLMILCLALSVCACGVTETTTAAATGAITKAEEIKQGQQTMRNVKDKINQASDQAQQRADSAKDEEKP
jgi:alpha-D-ribose 1-methylphosphonate 5-triphosphate diphosphatase PhnM